MIKYTFLVYSMLALNVARAEIYASFDELTRAEWQNLVARRLDQARIEYGKNRDPDFPSLDLHRDDELARLAIVSPEVLRDWRSGAADFTPEQGRNVALVLNGAVWWMLGWDFLANQYWDDVVDLDTMAIDPKILANFTSKRFRDMVIAAAKKRTAIPYRSLSHKFEPLVCAGVLSAAN